MNFQNKVVIVSGGGNEIGRCVARVAVLDIHAKAAKETEQLIASMGSTLES